MEYAIMAVVAVLGLIINSAVTNHQQNKELDQQKQLLEDEQQFTAEREDIAWQRSRPQQIYQDYLDTGFNPNLAAQSVLGGNAETATAGGSPSAPTTNSAIGALQSMFGQSQDQLYNALKNAAEIQNINANTNKTEIEAGILPRDFALRQLSATEQLKVWDKSIEKMSSEIAVNKEAVELAKQQNLYYGRVTESEIKERESRTMQAVANAINALEQAETEAHKRENIDADTQLKHAETDKVYTAEIPNIQADTSLKNAETDTEWNRAERERIAYEFEKEMGGVPLTADGQKYVMKLAKEGKYDEIRQFYQLVFTGALSQEVGKTLGTPKTKFRLPMGLMEYNSHNNGLYSLMNNPYWNPTQ